MSGRGLYWANAGAAAAKRIIVMPSSRVHASSGYVLHIASCSPEKVATGALGEAVRRITQLLAVFSSTGRPVEPRHVVDHAPQLGKERLPRRVLEARRRNAAQRSDLGSDDALHQVIVRLAKALEPRVARPSAPGSARRAPGARGDRGGLSSSVAPEARSRASKAADTSGATRTISLKPGDSCPLPCPSVMRIGW